MGTCKGCQIALICMGGVPHSIIHCEACDHTALWFYPHKPHRVKSNCLTYYGSFWGNQEAIIIFDKDCLGYHDAY